MYVDGAIVPATSVVPVQTASVAIDGAIHRIICTELRGSAGCSAIRAKRNISPLGASESLSGTNKEEWQEKCRELKEELPEGFTGVTFQSLERWIWVSPRTWYSREDLNLGEIHCVGGRHDSSDFELCQRNPTSEIHYRRIGVRFSLSC